MYYFYYPRYAYPPIDYFRASQRGCTKQYKHEKCAMGLFQKLALFLGIRKKEVNVLVIGLNNSGKSTVINQFKNEEDRVTEIVPTVGFSVERFQRK